jgi:RNA polymerase sigma-70 factor (ECF subfamily)
MGTFEELYRKHVNAVFRFAISVAGDRETAEDLTSEAFLALHRNLDAIDHSVEERYLEQLAESAAPAAETLSLEQWILDSPELRPVHRTCLMLRYVHDMTRAEIAAKTGLTETQVKGHLQYGLALLRKIYKGGETP